MVTFPIGLRLFMAVLLTSLAVSATGVWMLRDSMQRGFARYVGEIELKRLEPLAEALEASWRGGGWPDRATEQPTAQTQWLVNQLDGLRDAPGARFSGLFPEPPGMADHPPPEQKAPPARPGSPPPDRGFGNGPAPWSAPPEHYRLAQRIGLLTPTGQLLAGQPADESALRRPLQANGQVVGYLTLTLAASPSDAIEQAFLLDQRRYLLLIAGVCIALSALAAALLAAHFRSPVLRLLQATHRLMRGEFDTRTDIARSDELGMLAQAVNELARMLAQHEASRQQWIADTSHELRTPVAVLQAQIEALQDGVRAPEPAQFAAMQRQVLALGKLIDELHQLASADAGQLQHQFERLEPWDVVSAQADGFADRVASAGLSLHLLPLAQPVSILADAARLQQVLGNLLENSVRYTEAGGQVRLCAEVCDGRWLLHVDDSAPAVPEHALTQLGQRFFRVERSRSRARGGSGLGLALCRRIMAAHGGDLRFTHSALGGLRVTLDFPLA